MADQNNFVDPILQFFEYQHLHLEIQKVVKPYYDAAVSTIELTPFNQERVKALDLLLNAKDAAMRAKIYQTPVSQA